MLTFKLVETPYTGQETIAAGRYAPAATKDEFESILDDETDVAGPSHPHIGTQTDQKYQITDLHTRNLFTAWANLRTAGLRGLSRAFTASIVYTLIHELLFAALGGRHPSAQLMDRVTSEDPSTIHFMFSPILIIIMVFTKVLLIPLDVVITRQILGKPDSISFVGHFKSLISTVGMKALLPIVLPQILQSCVPMLLQDLSTWLHFLYLRETAVQPGWYAFFAIVEVVWRLLTFIFIQAPLTSVLYRAQTSVIAHLPKFESFVPYPTSYISPLSELKQIVEEEHYITGTWYGRYMRHFKIVLLVGIVMFFAILLVAISLGLLLR